MMFQILALLCMAAFYTCYFAKLLAQRRQGISTMQLGKNNTGLPRLVERSLQIVTLAIPLVQLVCIGLNRSALPTPCRWVGFGIAAAGDGVFIAAVVTMADSWRAGVPKAGETELVTRGIFRYSRNPAFLGFDLLYLGVLLMFFSVPLWLLSLLGIVLLHLQIVNVEEDFLLEAFGQEYLDYRAKVNRYLGRRG